MGLGESRVVEVGDFGEDVREQIGFAQQGDCGGAIRVDEHAADFHADAFGADGVDVGGHCLDGGERVGVDREVECGGEADGAEHAELVFADAQARIADGADDALLEILLAADVIDDLVGDGIEEEAVDREVAALGIVLGVGECDAVGMAAVGVGGVGAERGDFDLAGGARAEDRDDAERGADGERAAMAEEIADLIGRGARGDVVVFGGEAEEFVANAAAGPERFEAGSAELLGDFEGEGALAGCGGHARGFGVQGSVSEAVGFERRASVIANSMLVNCFFADRVVPGNDVFGAGAEEVEDEFGGRLAEACVRRRWRRPVVVVRNAVRCVGRRRR